jgi:hypothetical protein
MQRCLAVAVCLGCLSCAPRADVTFLDALRWKGEARWTYHKGSVCDFKHLDVLCITGVDEGTQELARPYRRVDLTPSITQSMKRVVSSVTYRCEQEDERRIRAEYQGGYSLVTHSSPPHLGQRFALAFIRVESPQGWLADVVWTDTRGGSAEEVGLRFADAFSEFLAEARSTRCD